jgi:YbgC/YbaW family acyl-CoA thioester hydrolase
MFFGQTHIWQYKIRYSDLDMYSVLYHPNYFKICDSARNQAFEDYGYPVEEQLLDKVGFTIGSIKDVRFLRPIFMAEEIIVTTETIDVGRKSCRVKHAFSLLSKRDEIIFAAEYNLVFVSLNNIGEFPLNANNFNRLQTMEFTPKAKGKLNFSSKPDA